ncbi:aminodeoxychorismate lyase [Vibrio porteresiae]|uniref:Aminodeoxychorismate lyase n=1 Tax=Vibrio porteresiae DSM 19223 TaxID=1123496 RepID=A0ABZ0QF06_9VIBR|nr:aminodeoxychorismate lyase [Vibrio porteresiae]WPC74980.1 aminodeoxychorismate lyase [Vibrio porteresiae DSM 19223]
MIWVNGQATQHISIGDRSFQYGDGCFTTMLTRGGKIQFWDYHFERMQACLSLLGIVQPDWGLIANWLDNAILPEPYAGLKLHISRGSGGRGYSPTQVTVPNVTISHFMFPEHYRQWQQQGIALGVCRQQMGINPMLAGHKHNNRLEQVLLKAEAEQQGFADAVCCDVAGRVIETTMANLFWVKGSQLFTPSLERAGVAGVARRVILEQASALGLHVQLGDFSLNELMSAEEIFVSNAILGVAPVCQIDVQCFEIGKQTRRFQEIFHSC